jgi:hypothetical protein
MLKEESEIAEGNCRLSSIESGQEHIGLSDDEQGASRAYQGLAFDHYPLLQNAQILPSRDGFARDFVSFQPGR